MDWLIEFYDSAGMIKNMVFVLKIGAEGSSHGIHRLQRLSVDGKLHVTECCVDVWCSCMMRSCALCCAVLMHCANVLCCIFI